MNVLVRTIPKIIFKRSLVVEKLICKFFYAEIVWLRKLWLHVLELTLRVNFTKEREYLPGRNYVSSIFFRNCRKPKKLKHLPSNPADADDFIQRHLV